MDKSSRLARRSTARTELNVQTQGLTSSLGLVKIFLNSLGIHHIIAGSNHDHGAGGPCAHRERGEVFPKTFSGDCSVLRAVTGEDSDKVALLYDQYMRTDARIRVAILRGFCSGDAGAQVHAFPGAPRSHKYQYERAEQVASGKHHRKERQTAYNLQTK